MVFKGLRINWGDEMRSPQKKYMAKKSLPKITPVDYETAKKESTFTDYITNDGFSKCNTNLCGNVDQLPSEIGNVIKKLQSKEVSFDRSDENDLNKFRLIYQYTHLPNYINRFTSENVNADLYEFFNKIKTATDFSSIKSAFDLNSTCASYFDYFFSAIKHCQDPNKYPLQHTFWKNLCKYYFPTTSENFGYDDLCNIYNSCGIPFSDTPKHVYFAAYMDQLAINLAKELAKNITTYASTKIGEIFNITEYDKIMGVSRGKHNNIILPAIPTPALELHDPVLEPDSTPDPDPDSDSDSGPDPSHPLNLILYGPPGTGKTYYTLFHAISIIKGVKIEDLEAEAKSQDKKRMSNPKEPSGYELIKEKYGYEDLVKSGQIEFTTFHQSMSYEDFIEGIKPIPESGDIVAKHNNNPKSKSTLFGDGTTTIAKLSRMIYDVKPGLFKQICDKASKSGAFTHPIVLESVIDYFCFDYEKFSSLTEVSRGAKIFSISAINVTKEGRYKSIELKAGTERQSIQLDVIRRDYTDYKTGKIKSAKDIKPSRSSKSAVFGNAELCYGLLQKIKEFEDSKYTEYSKGSIDTSETKNKDNYVLIIDEINRGNVAQIFGELITLIEPSKRLGNAEKMQAILPYSSALKGEPVYFGVPNNLYIIGTMNTADRSVEALDTALRRRFSFEEMMPKPELLEYKEICGVKLSDLLETVNARIVALKDREHQIGHSYFMECKTEKDLKIVFKDKIIPLLQEYFYGDYKKIYYVLGGSKKDREGFVKIESVTKSDIFAVKIEEDYDYDIPEMRYEIQTIDETFDVDKAIGIMMKKETPSE